MRWLTGRARRLSTRWQVSPGWRIADWRGSDSVGALLLLSVMTVSMLMVRSHLNILNIALLFLVLVVLIPVFADRWTSVVSAIIAFLIFDFFFIRPYYTFTVAAMDHVLTLFVFLGVATFTSQLIYRVRVRTVEALARGRQMAVLFELSQALIADVTTGGILGAVVERMAAVLGTDACATLLRDPEGQLHVRAAVGPPPPTDDRDHTAVAAWVIEHRRPAGLGQRRGRHVTPHGTQHPPSRRPLLPSRTGTSLYVPIVVANRVIGLLYVHHAGSHQQFSNDDQQLLLTFANQIALALERISLTEEATQAVVLARSDALKSALLAAVSHDLRTPLAAIKTATTSLLQEGISWSPDDQRDLLQAVNEETDRLTRLVSNMLDLTRIEAGELIPQLDWNDPADAVHESVRRARTLLPRHDIVAHVPLCLASAPFDVIQIGQVLFNLIENAGKYAPSGTVIDASVQLVAGGIEFVVADRGPGIPAGEATRIFDKFYRVERPGGERCPVGAGIGLSICRGIVEAHGGHIWVEPRDGGGASFRFVLPAAIPNAAENKAAA